MKDWIKVHHLAPQNPSVKRSRPFGPRRLPQPRSAARGSFRWPQGLFGMWLRLSTLAFAIVVCACKPAGPVGEHSPAETADAEMAESTDHVERGPAMSVPNDETIQLPPPLPADRTPSASAPEESPLVVGGDVVPPVRLESSEILFSQRDCRWIGPIIIETVIDTKGRIESMRFLKEQPPECIQQPIRDSLKTWQFKPAELHGEPVSVYYMLTVNIHWQ